MINLSRTCFSCGSVNTRLDKKRYPQWYLNRGTDLVLCSDCNKKLVKHPRYYSQAVNRETVRRTGIRYLSNPDNYIKHVNKQKEYGKKKIKFLGKQIHIGVNPRKGICSKCGRRVGEQITRTNMHHERYDPTDLLKHTIELCVACHVRIHRA